MPKPQSSFDVMAKWIRNTTKQSSAYIKLMVGGEQRAILSATNVVPRQVNSSFQPSTGHSVSHAPYQSQEGKVSKHPVRLQGSYPLRIHNAFDNTIHMIPVFQIDVFVLSHKVTCHTPFLRLPLLPYSDLTLLSQTTSTQFECTILWTLPHKNTTTNASFRCR